MTVDRFWAKVDRTDTCWRWTGCRSRQGYPYFWPGHGTTAVLAYRWAYEDARGPIPAGHRLRRLCRTRSCVRPDHRALRVPVPVAAP